MEKVAGEQGLALQQLFPYKSSYFLEIQIIIKSHSLMLGTSNFAILVFSICSFHFWHSLSYSPQYKRLLGKLWSRDPSCKGPIWGFAMVGYSVTYVWSKNISEKEGKWVWIQNKRELDIYSWVQISEVDFISKWLKTYSLSLLFPWTFAPSKLVFCPPFSWFQSPIVVHYWF